jgi:hypothetical protein
MKIKTITLLLILLLAVTVAGCIEQPVEIGEEEFCNSDNECIPLPSDCHPEICINNEYAGNYETPEVCTEIFMLNAAYKPEDCICVNNRCTNKNKVDNVDPDSSSLTMDEALEIIKNSDCAQEELEETVSYNINTKTWWFDLNLEKEGCNPACVVNEETKTAEINWRCTGLIVP